MNLHYIDNYYLIKLISSYDFSIQLNYTTFEKHILFSTDSVEFSKTCSISLAHLIATQFQA